MKHPALTRVMALTLSVLCFVMLLAGGLGMRSAVKEHLRSQDDLERLNDRVEEYRVITQALEGTISFKEAQTTLDERQEKHDDDAAKHRTELATYTAAKGGVTEGISTMDQADAEFLAGKLAYEQNRQSFEEQAASFEQIYSLYALGAGLMNGLQENSSSLSGAMAGSGNGVRALTPGAALDDPGEPEARKATALAAYDALLAAVDQALTVPSAVEGLVARAQEISVEPEQIQAIVQQLRSLPELLSGIGDTEGLDAGTLDSVRQSIAGLVEAGADLAYEAAQIVPSMQGAAAELSVLRLQIQANRDMIAAMDPETELDDAGYASVQASYAADQTALAGYLGELAAGYDRLEQATAAFDGQNQAALEEMSDMSSQMETAKAAIDAGRAALDAAGREIEQGAAALYAGRAEIWFQMGKLEDQEAELKKEKEELDREAEELSALDQAAQEQKEMEERETATRLNLLSRDGIQALVDEGQELLPAAEAFAEQAAADADRSYRDRMIACIVMAVGALSGFLAIPAAFERMKRPLARLLPTLLCLGCAVASELIFVNMGRGSSYSALAAAVFAAAMLPLLWPEKKRES